MPIRLQDLVRTGPMGIAQSAVRSVLRRALRLQSLAAPSYRSPTEVELARIEREIVALGMPCTDLRIDPADLERFKAQVRFPENYHGGKASGVFDEKILEHYVAWSLLGLARSEATSYVDIAACASPWARLLRDRAVEAYAIDLKVGAEFSGLDYYRCEDATHSTFADASVGSASLQCAYEMFTGDDDVALLTELRRILRPGGRTVISPLYTHTHLCHYQTPEYYGRFPGDPGARAYVRRDAWGVPSSRKYDAQALRKRVWDNALRVGLSPSLLVLRNKHELGRNIYLHFILVLDRPQDTSTTAPGDGG